MHIVLSKNAQKRIERLRDSLKITDADVVEQALIALERRTSNFRAMLENDTENHDLSEQDGIVLALEAQNFVRSKRN
jgi:hypothetical protein